MPSSLSANLPSSFPDVIAPGAKNIYFELNAEQPISPCAHERSRAFLNSKLMETEGLPCDLPNRMEDLTEWMESSAEQASQQYRAYLASRRAGKGRRYFSNKSHALFFLNAVAPTKLVDGSWLYGLLQRWDDPRFTNLIRIYLEELGEGMPDKNHVVLYRKLLDTHGCASWQQMDDAYFTQGAIQLCLAHHAADFLPEVIGFNLGYEQLPLHLLITAYELNELGIDPYYFTLHVTVDNASTGHARKALQAVFDSLPQAGNRAEFLRRMVNGYKLNQLGIDTLTAIDSFDITQTLLSTFRAKAKVGAAVHSDYCRVGGRSVSDWLSEPERMLEFLTALEAAGWIKRHEAPENSRFWKLISGERAEMFGVFSSYEQQLIRDWITGDAGLTGTAQPGTSLPRQPSFRAKQRMDESIADTADATGQRRPAYMSRGVFRNQHARHRAANDHDDFNFDLRLLEDELAALKDRRKIMSRLVELLSPAVHHTSAGMMATRIFNRMFNA